MKDGWRPNMVLTSCCPVSEAASTGGGGVAGDVAVDPCW